MNGLKFLVTLFVFSGIVIQSVEGFTSAYGHSIRLSHKAKPDPQRQRRLTTVRSYISQVKRQESNEVGLRTFFKIFSTTSFPRHTKKRKTFSIFLACFLFFLPPFNSF